MRRGMLRGAALIGNNEGDSPSLPCAAPEAMTESGRPAAQAPGIKFTGTEKGKAVFELASGHYEFVSRMR